MTSLWPNNSKFALLLSHDVDELYSRELFRILGDINHLRRIWAEGEPGRAVACIKRIARALIKPRPPGEDINTILAIERMHGYRSTFFLLEDETFNRYGGRYRYADPIVRRIVENIRTANCEIAVHGAYHNGNSATRYRQQARSFATAFGESSKGIRNHYLRHDGLITWQAQHIAGYEYDASFGNNEMAGIKEMIAHPFHPLNGHSFVVLPMTIMDSSIFRRMRLSENEAMSLCRKIADEVADRNGLLCLSWHNNFFGDPEYDYWQRCYEMLLEILSERRPYCATGIEIARWWREEGGKRMNTCLSHMK